MTGLKINFDKSQVFGMSIGEKELRRAAEILGCKASSFPMTYLGLPLHHSKPRRANWNPLLEKIQKKLAGWKGKLLNLVGRLVPTNAVIIGIPLYWMSSLLLPQFVVQKIDKIRRSFVWRGFEECKSGHCRV